MSKLEKTNHMRYRPFRIELVKVTNNWLISSLGTFPQVLESMNRFFASSLKTAKPSGKSKN